MKIRYPKYYRNTVDVPFPYTTLFNYKTLGKKKKREKKEARNLLFSNLKQTDDLPSHGGGQGTGERQGIDQSQRLPDLSFASSYTFPSP